jgi:signal transduction histidine kinase
MSAQPDPLFERIETIADVLDTPSAYFWKVECNQWQLHLRCENGMVTREAAGDAYELYKPVRYRQNQWWHDADGRLQTASLITRLSDPQALFTPSQREMLLRNDTPALVNIPVILDGKALAAVTSPLKTGMVVPSPWRLALVCSLANQAALALQMASLAETAKHAAVTEERNRLARDMHDTVAQGFAAIMMQLQAANRARDRIPAEVFSYLDTAMILARENLVEARRSVRTLRPASSRAGFAGALHDLTTRAQRLTDASIYVHISPRLPVLPRKVEDELLRITQEALSNAIKHACAQLITIDASALEEGILISVKDDGRGFDADSPTAGYGLMACRNGPSRSAPQ